MITSQYICFLEHSMKMVLHLLRKPCMNSYRIKVLGRASPIPLHLLLLIIDLHDITLNKLPGCDALLPSIMSCLQTVLFTQTSSFRIPLRLPVLILCSAWTSTHLPSQAWSGLLVYSQVFSCRLRSCPWNVSMYLSWPSQHAVYLSWPSQQCISADLHNHSTLQLSQHPHCI